MSKVTLLAAALALAIGAAATAQAPAADADLAKLVADCNVVADLRAAKQRNFRACGTLATDGRLSLVEPAAATAYQQYREERFQECQRRQASPRGASRPSNCEP